MSNKPEIPELKDHEILTKTSTPLHTKDWYIKWASSIILIGGMILTSNNVYPLNIIFHSLGLIGWLIVSIMWNDRALIVINAVGLSIMANGMVAYFIGN
tara:strand:- start:3327 stop:3623 length:297 start_codon:yes stop_codon:yes gene_type:complete